MIYRLWLLALALLVPVVAGAEAPPALPMLAGFGYKALTADDGAPGLVGAIVQTDGGYLWVGTPAGLYRYDGVTFEHLAGLEHKNDLGIADIVPLPGGETWLRYGDRTLGLVQKGRIVPLPPRTPNAERPVRKMIAGPDGTLWAVTAYFLYRYRNHHWDAFAVPEGVVVNTIVASSDGTIWMTSWQGLCRFDPEREMVVKVDQGVTPYAGVATDANGRLWIADRQQLRVIDARAFGTRVPTGKVVMHLPPELERSFLSFDRSGRLWIAGNSRSIMRVSASALLNGDSGGAQWFRGSASGGIFTMAVFEDVEGTIWVGNELGLERFKPVSIVQQAGPNGALFGVPLGGPTTRFQVATDGVGSIYLRKGKDIFQVSKDGVITPTPFKSGLHDDDAICGAKDGGLWIRATGNSLHRILGSGSRDLTFLVSSKSPKAIDNVVSCLEDRTGNIWVANDNLGFYRYSNGKSLKIPLSPDNDTALPYAMAEDTAGNIMTYYGFENVSTIANGRVAVSLTAKHNPVTFIETIATVGRYTYLLGAGGVLRFDGKRYQFLSADRYPVLREASGLVEDRWGGSWILSERGLVRFDTAALSTAFDDPGKRLTYRLFDDEDGLSGSRQDSWWPNMALGKDGRLWVATTVGIFTLDPARLLSNPRPPEVVIKTMVAGGTAYPPSASPKLARGITDVQINFTALSLAVPRRVRFLYRLDDQPWVDPGLRRQAIYTNLPPGEHVFTVVAANEHGVWNKIGASYRFSITPTFVQTGLFKLLCALVVFALGYLLYLLRLRQAASRIRLGMEAELRERERIARELHDTLLQGIHGLMLHLQTAKERLPAGHDIAQRLGRALDLAQDALVEGRNRVAMLRGGYSGQSLRERLEDLAGTVRDASSLSIAVSEEGPPRKLRAESIEEIARIVAEALANAVRHSGARSVEIRIHYAGREVVVEVVDDGVGLPREVRAGEPLPGHFGMVGMRERAKKIGATLTIGNVGTRGTHIALRVPFGGGWTGRLFDHGPSSGEVRLAG